MFFYEKYHPSSAVKYLNFSHAFFFTCREVRFWFVVVHFFPVEFPLLFGTICHWKKDDELWSSFFHGWKQSSLSFFWKHLTSLEWRMWNVRHPNKNFSYREIMKCFWMFRCFSLWLVQCLLWEDQHHTFNQWFQLKEMRIRFGKSSILSMKSIVVNRQENFDREQSMEISHLKMFVFHIHVDRH